MSVIVGLQDEVIPRKVAHQLPWWENRLGGFPTWLSKESPPASTLRCKRCGLKLALIIQINAPSTDSETEQRVLYLYGCTKWACTNEAGGWCVLRGVRATTRTSAAGPTPPSNTTAAKPSTSSSTTANTLPTPSTTTTHGLTSGSYKSAALKVPAEDAWGVEADDWGVDGDAGQDKAWGADNSDGAEEVSMTELTDLLSKRDAHIQALPKNILNKILVQKAEPGPKEEAEDSLSGAMARLNVDDKQDWSSDTGADTMGDDVAFQGYYIWASGEPEPMKASKHELKLLKQYEQENGKASFDSQSEEWQSEKYESVGGAPDAKAFYRFVKRLEREPNQVFRYEYAGESLNTKATSPKVPLCEHCGAPRFFEIQCFPKLLSCLSLEDRSTGSGAEADD
ncbi:hypothetical protein SARC_08833, partial [Sphaeroforma arctica JP610]